MRPAISAAMLWALGLTTAAAAHEGAGSRSDDAAGQQAEIDEVAAGLHALEAAARPNGGLPDNSPAALQARREAQDELYARLLEVDYASLSRTGAFTFEVLRETLEAERGVRVCRRELWNVDHIAGWHIGLSAWAGRQPVGSAEARSAALAQWRRARAFIEQEISSLRTGVQLGYTAPKAIVQRVLRQLDEQLATPTADSPLNSPAQRAGDPEFAQALQEILEGEVRPALRRYRDFLRGRYLPQARDSLAAASLPQGRTCYQALLRRETTLNSSPREIFERGQRMIEDNRNAIIELGSAAFGSRDFDQILARLRQDPANQFRSAQEVMQFTREVAQRARASSSELFLRPVDAELNVVAFPEYQRNSGMNPYYEPARNGQPARYLVNLQSWRDNSRGQVEVTTVHEAWPGHHLQVSIARSLPHGGDFLAEARFPAYIEGWGRYAERLADEHGMYSTPHARILWRAKPGFGMVVDPGLHAFGWSRERAADFLMSSGLFGSEQVVEDMIDRIAVMPAQLTAYDAGGSEILRLRELARERLGDAFDLREFHAQVLGVGYAPLSTLRKLTMQWIERESRR